MHNLEEFQSIIYNDFWLLLMTAVGEEELCESDTHSCHMCSQTSIIHMKQSILMRLKTANREHYQHLCGFANNHETQRTRVCFLPSAG